MANHIPILVLLALTALLGCGRAMSFSDPSVVGPNAAPVADGHWANTVALTSHGNLTCTGVLIAPTVVLTAAHCLPSGADLGTISVHRGLGEDGGRFGDALAVVRGARHPAYPSGVWGSSDLAYLILAEAQNDVELVPVATTVFEVDAALLPGSSLRIVGFGVHDNETRALGRKFEGEARLKFRSAREIALGDDAGDACDGDSGGPAFGRTADGGFRLLGITSRGPAPCGNADYPGIWTLVAPYACWLEAETGWRSGAGCGEQVEALADASDLCLAENGDDGARRTVAALRTAFVRADGRRRFESDVTCEELQAWAGAAREVDLSRSLLIDARPLAALRSVERLNLDDNALTDVTPLRGLTALRFLRVGWNALANQDVIELLTASGVRVTGPTLQAPTWRLDRRNAFVQRCLAAQSTGDALAAAEMGILRRAACFGTACSCHSANDALQRARSLDLSRTAIADLSAIAEFTNLQYVDLSGVATADLAPLAGFENLRELRLPRSADSIDALAAVSALGDLAILE